MPVGMVGVVIDNRGIVWMFKLFLTFNLCSYSKDAVKSVLRIGPAHNKGGPADINIAPIFASFEHSDKTL